MRYPLKTVTYSPGSLNDMSFGSMHPGGAHFLFGDGHIQFLNNSTDLRVLQALATRNGREYVQLP